MKKYKNKILIIILCSFIFIVFFGTEKRKMLNIEDLDIYVGIGLGVEKGISSNIDYRVSAAANMYKEDESIESALRVGKGHTIGKTREDRQRKTGKDFFLGLIKVYILDEEYARHGIRSVIDIVFKNPIIDDNAYLVVCKGKNEKYFSFNAPGYDIPSEYVSDMIKNSVSYNFFKDDYKIKNAILLMDAEGKNIIAPYIEIDNNNIKISGMGIFNKDKLEAVLNMKDTKIMNMLRENKVKGVISIQRDSKKYIDVMAKSYRKIKCNKVGDKYNFKIDLRLEGEIIDNQLYANLIKDTKVLKKIENDLKVQVEKECTAFLDKMTNQYKLDMLQLGFLASAKYGRGTGVDWNQVVSDSNIIVNVKVKIKDVGRGQY